MPLGGYSDGEAVKKNWKFISRYTEAQNSSEKKRGKTNEYKVSET